MGTKRPIVPALPRSLDRAIGRTAMLPPSLAPPRQRVQTLTGMETFPFAPVALSPSLTICRVQLCLWWWCVLAACGGGSPTEVYFAVRVGLDVN